MFKVQVTNLESCFICGNPVIDFSYHSTYFDRFSLIKGDLAFEKGAVGTCHTECLTKSKWAEYWFLKMKERHLDLFKFKKIGDLSDGGLAVLDDNDDLILIYANGMVLEISDDEIDFVHNHKKKTYIQRKETINLEFNNSIYVDQLRNLIEKNKRIGLETILTDVDQVQYFSDSNFLKDCELVFDNKLKREWRNNWFACKLEYKIPLQKKELEIILSL